MDEIKDLVGRIEKRFGKEAVVTGKMADIPKFTSGSLALDDILGGGWAVGRIIEMYGAESCFCGNTEIQMYTFHKDGKRKTIRKKSLEYLYKRFHEKKETEDFKVTGFNEEERIILNSVKDVVYNGKKVCYKITTELGKILSGVTEDHLIYTGKGGYTKVKDLREGNTVYIHDRTPFKGKASSKRPYLIRVKYHPSQKWREINGCKYCQVETSHLAYEAYKNDLSYDEYVNILNKETSETINKFWTVPKGYHIHHLDKNPFNDEYSNLELIEGSSHNQEHALENHNKLRFILIPTRIISIEKIGEKDVYDIKCEDPYHNYIADGIAVHNCGKTTIAIHAAVEMQKRGRAVGYVDVEQALDPDYMKALGLDMSSEKFVLSQPDNAEDALEIAREMISTKEIGLVIIDSIAGLVPKAILQGEAGDAKVALVARLMSSQINIFKNICKKNGCTLICINQIRDKVGGGFGFGGATTTTPGGHALKFYASQRIELARIGSDKEGEEAVANRVKITCKKNKVAPPFKKCEVVIRFGVGLDKVQETLNQAILYGICSKKGAWYYYDDTRLGQGLPNTRDLLLEDKALLEDIQDTVRLFREDDKKKKEAEV